FEAVVDIAVAGGAGERRDRKLDWVDLVAEALLFVESDGEIQLLDVDTRHLRRDEGGVETAAVELLGDFLQSRACGLGHEFLGVLRRRPRGRAGEATQPVAPLLLPGAAAGHGCVNGHAPGLVVDRFQLQGADEASMMKYMTMA